MSAPFAHSASPIIDGGCLKRVLWAQDKKVLSHASRSRRQHGVLTTSSLLVYKYLKSVVMGRNPFAGYEQLPIDQDVADAADRIRRSLPSGVVCADEHLLIMGQAIVFGRQIATVDSTLYPPYSGVQFQDWSR